MGMLLNSYVEETIYLTPAPTAIKVNAKALAVFSPNSLKKTLPK